MLTTLKFKSTPEVQDYFCTDIHFNHDRPWIVPPRGFKTVQEHDAALVKAWNAVVRPTDRVWYLGDFIFNAQAELAMSYFRMLNGHIYLVWGNHTSGVRQVYKRELKNQFGREDIEVYPLTWDNKVTFIGDYVKLILNGQMIILSHFPYRVWDSQHHGAWNMSGHSHGNDKGRLPEVPEGKCFDCGVDIFKRPISFDEVKTIMDKKNVQLFDHHNSETHNGF
jgi:calcineurin-like phosphoesterase family protein